ncbi:MAG: BlaI/MecI/CopY family transcriptional regulator [Micropruina sp.]|nr:BlaI/MecI/CopY family transcriptional regulator [Micropruina sp.]
MDILWRGEQPLPVRDVQGLLAGDRELAYTTVMTVLDRLAKKGVVHRDLEGRAWLYRPAISRADLFADEIVALLNSGTKHQRHDVWAAVNAKLGHELLEEPAE